jgi:hypothetical protein
MVPSRVPPLASGSLVGHRQHLELLERGDADRTVSMDLDDAVGR